MGKYSLDKDFWDRLRNPPSYNNFEIYIVTKLICGEDLSGFDEDRVYSLIFDMALTNKVEEEDFKLKIKKFNQSIPNFLEKLREIFSRAEKNASIIYRENVRFLEHAANLPAYGGVWDSDEVLDFIRSLKEDIYSFSEAERLLGVSRQTLTKYAKEGTHGLKTVRMKKSDYLTKESLVNFYREKWKRAHNA